MTTQATTSKTVQAEMLGVGTVAQMLGCSTRHVYRLADRGAMPTPKKLGALVRWSRVEIEDWIKAGCPACRKGGAR